MDSKKEGFKMYKCVLKQECLKEILGGIADDLFRYIDKHCIDINDESNPIVIFRKQLIDMQYNILDPENDDEKKLNELMGFARYSREYVNKLECN